MHDLVIADHDGQRSVVLDHVGCAGRSRDGIRPTYAPNRLTAQNHRRVELGQVATIITTKDQIAL